MRINGYNVYVDLNVQYTEYITIAYNLCCLVTEDNIRQGVIQGGKGDIPPELAPISLPPLFLHSGTSCMTECP